jgi:hypothetical protein
MNLKSNQSSPVLTDQDIHTTLWLFYEKDVDREFVIHLVKAEAGIFLKKAYSVQMTMKDYFRKAGLENIRKKT